MTALTNQWLDGSAANYGVILWATNEDTPGYELRFRSSLASVDLPVLEVVYTRPTKTVYFLKDHLGSIRATVDELGQVVGYDDYDAWGYILPGRSLATGTSTVAGAAKNKFTGKEWDDELGLRWYYFGARYYDPEVGRWWSVDRLKEKYPALSPYNYAAGDPIRLFDPDGKKIIDAKTRQEISKAEARKRTIRIIGKAFNRKESARINFIETGHATRDVLSRIKEEGISGLREAIFPTKGSGTADLGEPIKLNLAKKTERQTIRFIDRTSEFNTVRVNTLFQGERILGPDTPPSLIGKVAGSDPANPENLIFQLSLTTEQQGQAIILTETIKGINSILKEANVEVRFKIVIKEGGSFRVESFRETTVGKRNGS